MPNASVFFTAADMQRLGEHLAKEGTSVVLTMHSGDVKSLMALEPPSIHGRMNGTTVNGFAIVIDPERVESWSMVQGDLEDIAPTAPADLLALTIKREDAIDALLTAVDGRDFGAVIAASADLHQVQDAMRAMTDPEPSQMAQDRPGEFGGYEGLTEAEEAAADTPDEAQSVLDEPDVAEKVAGQYEPKVVDIPKRRGRPPKHG